MVLNFFYGKAGLANKKALGFSAALGDLCYLSACNISWFKRPIFNFKYSSTTKVALGQMKVFYECRVSKIFMHIGISKLVNLSGFQYSGVFQCIVLVLKHSFFFSVYMYVWKEKQMADEWYGSKLTNSVSQAPGSISFLQLYGFQIQ